MADVEKMMSTRNPGNLKGLRLMEKKDVPEAMKLLNKYLKVKTREKFALNLKNPYFRKRGWHQIFRRRPSPTSFCRVRMSSTRMSSRQMIKSPISCRFI